MASTLPFHKPMKYLLSRDWRLLKTYEGNMCRTFDAVTAVSDEDKQSLIEAGARPDIVVIPIAIDIDQQPLIHRTPSAPHIVHIGTMYWPANIDGIRWFLDQIYPLIKQKVPNVHCTLIGARPPQDIKDREQTDPSLKVTGYVDDPLPYLQDSSMMIVPLRAGGGMRVKILNAFAQGLPMVTTTVGCEGIHVTDGYDILIADSPEEFATQSACLLTDATLNEELTLHSRQTAEQKYDYRQACLPLDQIYS